MKKLFSKAKEFSSTSREPVPLQGSRYSVTPQSAEHHDVPSTIQPPTPLDVLRYRYHHGSNLGGIFVLEQWLFPSMYDQGAKGGSELDAVIESIAVRGVDGTREKWERHWANALSDDALQFLANHCTSIRLPIGYFTLGNQFTAKTPFEGNPSKVYANAWSAVNNLCSRLHSAGIGVLLDFHACPGGANTDDHSGTSSGKAEMWDKKRHLDSAIHCLEFIASEVHHNQVPGCIGIQCCNEATYDCSNMYDWYEDVLHHCSQINPDIPLYISDGWNLQRAMAWAASRNRVNVHSCPVIVDTHKYYTFSPHHKSQSPQQIIQSIPSELNEVHPFVGDVTGNGAVDVVIGEWSCVLDGETWAKANSARRDDLVREFGTVQCSEWRKRGCGGSFFWTAKMNWMDGGEWGFFEMNKKAAIATPQHMLMALDDIRTLISKASAERHSLRVSAANTHTEHWGDKGQFEHWRFEVGWDVGFEDAMAFFGMRIAEGGKAGGDTIGMLDSWIRKRIKESGMAGEFLWEFEHGFRQGEGAFKGIVGIS